MKKILFLSIAHFLILNTCLSVGLGYAKDVSEKDVIKIEQEAQQKELESKKLQAQAIQLNLELSKIDKNLIALAKKIQSNEDLLSISEKEQQKLSKDLSIKEADFVKENNSLVQTVASLQNMSLNPSESIILQPLSPVDIIRSAILLREIIPYLNETSSKLKADLDYIYQQKQKLEETVALAKKQSSDLDKQQKEMKNLLKKKTSLRANVEKKGAETKKVAENLASKAKDLRELLEEIERQKEIARKKQEEERKLALEKEKNKQKVVDVKTHKSIKEQASTGRFANAKGTLSQPVRGTLITDYGEMISNGVTSKGIVYKTRPNAQVIAPYDGTVIFSGPFKGYGNLIIVEHGDGYLSLLAGLGNIDCELGQMLLTGEPIGTMPETAGAKLYVEIRKDRQPINPAPWIAG
jgi:septal ring factor EnvC (AmiA/AmiB activator)